ncbi:hypothetical protein CASFOL_022808 [Castilleja foliolosa]|uniref:Guanine nucleotide-binding protein alpha subunit n=1 Tax=Castilleja foliolosa TaxID=1961234 RepID=A0ABD3CWT4_9LAMI
MGNLFCCIQVDQSTDAIKERFGRFVEVLEPGCHCLPWCFGSQLAGHLTLRLQQLDVRCETKTKDNVLVNVVASIQYRAIANKVSDAFYKLSNTKGQIQAYVFDVIRASVPNMNLDDAFEQKNEIAKAVEDELEKAMSAYGYEIVQTLIVDIEPDEHVKRAMNKINAGGKGFGFHRWLARRRENGRGGGTVTVWRPRKIGGGEQDSNNTGRVGDCWWLGLFHDGRGGEDYWDWVVELTTAIYQEEANKLIKEINSATNEQTAEIDRRIEQETKVEKHIQKLLLLGPRDSGKSTIFKQIKLLFESGFEEVELKNYVTIIHANVYQTIKV